MHQIEIELDVPVPMRDGTELRADVYRPSGAGPFPVLVSRGPYDKNFLWDETLDFKAAVRAGYILVLQDVRGRFASGGEWMPWTHERDDGYDTIEWAAALPTSNGRVGMFGPSYLGSTQWSAAISGAPHLVAIAPSLTWSDPEDGMLFRGGAIEFGINTVWSLEQSIRQYPRAGLEPEEMRAKMLATIAALDSLPTSGHWGLPSGAPPILAATGQPDVGVARALIDRATTAETRVASRYGEIDLPTLNCGGWFDVFLQGTLDNYVGMRSRGRTARLVVGPWTHTTQLAPWNGGVAGDVNFGVMAQVPGGRTTTDLHLDWYGHWLKDAPATEAHQSGALIFVMGINQWRIEPDWPLARAVDTSLYLDSDSTLSWSAPESSDSESEYIYDPANPVLSRGGAMHLGMAFPAGPMDQRATEERDDVLVFSTAPLDADLEITGRVRATIYASTDGTCTDWVVRLCDVDENGVSRNIVDGIARVRTDPDRVDEIEIDLWSTSIVIRKGHLLRVQVTSSNFPRWDRNLNTGEPEVEGTTMRVARQRIFHDVNRPSRVILPIVPAM